MTRKFVSLSADQKAALLAASNDFHIARSQAINSYAEVEQRLGMIFNRLLAAGPEKSSAVFGLIQNQRNGLALVERLMRITYHDRYRVFFESVLLHVKGMDSTRNDIAHWIMLHNYTGEGPFEPKTNLYLSGHPDFFDERKMYRHELIAFRDKCDFYRYLLQAFWNFIHIPEIPNHVPMGKRSWHEIFVERVVYPPPTDHPLARTVRSRRARHPRVA